MYSVTGIARCLLLFDGMVPCPLSRTLYVQSGVRQGGRISPTIFNMFVNAFIVQLRELSVGCHIGTEFVGCLLNILSPSIVGLQSMLDKCSDVASVLFLQFNTSKSHCIVFGKTSKCTLPLMVLGGMTICWCSSVKYLGVHLLSGRFLKFDIMSVKRAFYAACNSIFIYGADVDELALLSLQESYSLPVLMYSMPALPCRQLNRALNVCWNNVIRKLFNYNKCESVKSVLFHIDRLNITHLIMMRKINFYRNLHASKNCTLCNVFMSFLSSGCDMCCVSQFLNKSLLQLN